MFFTFLVFLAAFLIEAIGTYVSVVGLSALFAANPVIILLAVALDIGKLVSVSFVYKYWKKINLMMKTYMTIASFVLVMITSAGAFGFLSGEFQKAIAGNTQQTVMIASLTEEQGRLQKRKETIDKQIAQLPDTNVRGRTQLIRQFGPEVTRINSRLAELDKQLPELKVANIDKEVKVGPIIYIANAFDTTPEKAVKWVILTIIFVFDPLAIALLIAGNFLLLQRSRADSLPPADKWDSNIQWNPDVDHSKIVEGDLVKQGPLIDKITEETVHAEVDIGPAVGNEFPPTKPDHAVDEAIRARAANPEQVIIKPGAWDKEDTRVFFPAEKPIEREKVVIKPVAPPPPSIEVKHEGDKEVISLIKPLMPTQLDRVSDNADIIQKDSAPPSKTRSNYE
jgi:cell division protein FtsB